MLEHQSAEQEMSLTSDYIFWISVIFLIVCLIFLVRRHHQWKSIIDRIPGPKGLPFFGVALEFFTAREDVTVACREISAPYFANYPIMRLWLGPYPIVIIMKAEAAKVLLSSNKHIQKGFFYKYFRSFVGDGLLTSTGTKWQQRRKFITPAFHFRILESFLSVMNEQADILIKILDQKCQQANREDFDVYPYLTRCALDIICATAMGQELNTQLNAESEYLNAVTGLTELMQCRMLRPWLGPDLIFRLSPLWRAQQRYVKIVHGFTDKIIEMKRKHLELSKMANGYKQNSADEVLGLKRRVALLDLLLEQSMESNSKGGQALTNEDIREEVDTFMFAGHDTTSVSIGWAIYFIGQLPELQQKIVDELDAVFGDSDRQATSEDLHNLKYLECFMKESMRVIPTAPMFARYLNEDLDICGYKIPKGVNVLVATYWIHNDPAHFPDPDKFDPDRFLSENSQNRDPFCYLPFSAGLRNCIGQKYGIMEEKVILSRILRKFKVVSMVEDLWSNVSLEVIARPIRGIRIKLEPRSKIKLEIQ